MIIGLFQGNGSCILCLNLFNVRNQMVNHHYAMFCGHRHCGRRLVRPSDQSNISNILVTF